MCVRCCDHAPTQLGSRRFGCHSDWLCTAVNPCVPRPTRSCVCVSAITAAPASLTPSNPAHALRVESGPRARGGVNKHFINTLQSSFFQLLLRGWARSHPPGFAWATSVVRHGGVVSDRYDLQPSHGEAFDCRLCHREMFVHPHGKALARVLFFCSFSFPLGTFVCMCEYYCIKDLKGLLT